MASIWNKLRKRFVARAAEPIRQQPQSEVDPVQQTDPLSAESAPRARPVDPGLPNTYQPAGISGDEATQAELFDPSLKQFPKAFRLSDPAFKDPTADMRWRAARAQAIEHLTRVVAYSQWRDHLILRGSLLLKAWLGAAAREPGDIDWVVAPDDLKLSDSKTGEMIEDLIRLSGEFLGRSNMGIDPRRVSIDDIWAYERAPGRRVAFPWKADGVPPGVVQMDLVFGEKLPADPVWTRIPMQFGDDIQVRAVTKELSLAWKLLCLETDCYPQGKDLYDAVLLAEQVHVPLQMLQEIFRDNNAVRLPHKLNADLPLTWEVDWDSLKQEFPWVAGAAIDWQKRLCAALAPTFAISDESIPEGIGEPENK